MTTTPPLLIRPSYSSQELADHLQGYVEVAESFSPDPLPADTATRQLHWLTTLPGYRPEQVRNAYRHGEHLGGYRIYERQVRIGAARLATGCIKGVYTRAAARKKGVATALMHDAIAYARAHEYPLLLLNGIPKFYHRYGFCDVYDVSVYDIDRHAILALPESPYTVRHATLEDAPRLLALYEHQFAPHPGSFARSLEEQIHWMQHLKPADLGVAVDSANQVRGYLVLAATQAQGPFILAGARVWELVGDDWPAAVALLQDHTRQLPAAAGTVLYSVPPTSPLGYWMRDALEVVDISTWDNPVFGWALCEQTFCHQNAGWMARLVSLPALTQAMLPEWQARWQRSLARWSGNLSLEVGAEACTVQIADTRLQLLETPDPSAPACIFTPQAFTQALFGYIPILRAARPREHQFTSDLASVLTILFPDAHPWIPTSDWF